MGQTTKGAILIFCKRQGITYEDYIHQKKLGLKWCCFCKRWLKTSKFGKDSSKTDGLSSGCLECRKGMYRQRYIPEADKLPCYKCGHKNIKDKKQIIHEWHNLDKKSERNKIHMIVLCKKCHDIEHPLLKKL